jgi:hypothetical protein
MADIEVNLKTSIEIFPDRVNALIDTPDGPVGVVVRQAAEAVLQAAIPKIGTRYSGTTGKVTDGRSGRLRDTGRVESIGGSAYAVVFDHPIAFLHHEGKSSGYTIPITGNRYSLTNPHGGTRSNGEQFSAIGPVIWTGNTSGNPYLRDAADEVGLRSSGQLLRGRRPASLFRLPSG